VRDGVRGEPRARSRERQRLGNARDDGVRVVCDIDVGRVDAIDVVVCVRGVCGGHGGGVRGDDVDGASAGAITSGFVRAQKGVNFMSVQ